MERALFERQAGLLSGDGLRASCPGLRGWLVALRDGTEDTRSKAKVESLSKAPVFRCVASL